MTCRFYLTIACALPVFFGALVWALPAAANPNKACDLITAERVSSILGVKMTNVTDYRDPDSVCTFVDRTRKFPRWMVFVALFTPAMMRQANANAVAENEMGCKVPRTDPGAYPGTSWDAVPQCKKAFVDDSPAELYHAQPRERLSGQSGSPVPCQGYAQTSCFVSQENKLWAKRGNEVVAIAAVYASGEINETFEPGNSAREVEMLNSIWPKL